MAAEIIQIDTQDFTSQIYEGQDTNLISTFDLSTSFGPLSYIEYFIYDNNRNIITFDYNFTDYTIQNDGQSAGTNGDVSQIIIDPEQLLIDNGFDQGEYITYFNFFNKKIGSEFQLLYIAEISSDRTEIRLDSTALSNLDIVEQTTQFIQERETSTYFLDFYLNFGDNQLAIANNIQLDNLDPTNPTILVKLYESLPEEFDVNSTLWVVTTLEESIAYQVTFEDEPIVFVDFENISGPNFNIDLKDRVNNSTQNLSYSDLTSTSLTSSIQQLNSLLEEKEIDINVDYTSFENYIHFSSAQTRLENFYSKIQLIEQYSASIAVLNNTINSPTTISSSAAVYESKINNIITNFDGYEYFLYYENNTYAWPKTTSQKPYELAKSDSVAVLTWIGSDNEYSPYYGGLLYSASLYDNTNKDNLLYSIPEYLRDDPANQQYELFVQMVAQHYDNIWIYYNEVTQKYNADNRLEYGVSKDIVADVIRDFGIKLYQNNFSNDDLYTAFLGLTPEGGLFPFPNITGSLPTPSGFEYIEYFISASNDYIPLDDVNKSLYKRIYHNLPYLLKSKGTLPGLRALITSYGVPDTILRINEYGGKDKVDYNDWDYWQNEFNYAFNTSGSNFISSSWELNSDWNAPNDVPSTLMFRFKTDGLPTSNIPYSQSLWYGDGESAITLTYTGSAYTSGSYSGSIIDPYYQYATLTFYPNTNNSTQTSSVYLPFYDSGWWSVMVNKYSNLYSLNTNLSTQITQTTPTILNIPLVSSNNLNYTPSTGLIKLSQVGQITSSNITFTFQGDGDFLDVPYDFYLSSSLGISQVYQAFSVPFTGSFTETLYTGIDYYLYYVAAANNSISFLVEFDAIGSDSLFSLYAGNKIYEGGDNGTILGFLASSSLTYTSSNWDNTLTSYFPVSFSISGTIGYDISAYDVGVYDEVGTLAGSFTPFIGSYQEIRYYTVPISESIFIDYTMNPHSIEGNSLNSSPNELAFRASIGGELYTASISIHPKVTGSWQTTHSFTSDSNFYYDSSPNFIPNVEYTFADQPIAGIRNTVSDKIRVENNVMPEGDTLSPYMSLSQMANISQSYTPSINYLEVAFSPSNEINEDIVDQIGYFNIGEFIGDPRLRSSSAVTYPALDQLRNEYFQKYTKNYDLVDFIRLIKFFDNSLFKMIRDFVPARTSLAAGIVIKQHLLERNKYPQPQFSWQDLDISGTLKPTWNGYKPGTVEHFEGQTGGVFDPFNSILNTSQSWYENLTTPLGPVLVLHDSQDEFYNGELSGSVILVSNGIVGEAYPNDNIFMFYKPVYYYGTSSPEDLIFENNFLNNITSPENGEILFFEKYLAPGVSTPKYLKIAKTDLNGDNYSVPLGQFNDVIIPTPIFSFGGNINLTYNVTQLNENPQYYTYIVTLVSNDINPLYNNYLPLNTENQVLDYYVSSSRTTLTSFNPTEQPINLYDTELGNIIEYFNTSSGEYTLENTPNTPLLITASFNISQSGAGSPGTCSISLNRGGNITILSTTTFLSSFTGIRTISASYYGLSQDVIALTRKGGNNVSLTGVNLLVTQSRTVRTSSGALIVEPYLTIPNFYNSNQNALLNNAFDLRDSSYYMDVDYSSGLTEPVNFQSLINGSATRAKVQDSNYTSQRVIIPRYLGSKSTSQQLNQWTSGDTGTYGKLPTIESVKSYVAYAPSIGGWPPERMNASAIFVKYLIGEDGNVIIPNTSENSLPTIQQNFQTGDRVRITTPSQGSGIASQFRTVIRGGTRIEPILYTQTGHSPASWNNVTMSFTTDFIGSSAVDNYTAKAYPSIFPPPFGDGSYSGINFNNVVSIGSPGLWSSNAYVVDQGVIGENVTLQIKIHIEPILKAGVYAAQTHYAIARLIKKRGSDETILDEIVKSINVGPQPNNITPNDISFSSIDFNFPIQPQNLQPNDEIFVRAGHFTSTLGPVSPGVIFKKNSSYFQVSQIPSPTNVQVTSSGTNSLWGYPDNTKLYAITSSNLFLNEFYNQGFYQVDISGSGFNPISLPWSVKYGDEFRFEGNENNTFVVKKIYDVGETDNERVSQTGSIEVQFGNNLPSASIDLDHFLIRRYVDDASQILIEGFRPTGTEGPYIITPEYVTPSLNKNVDTFITDLTQKGLL